MTPRPSLHFVRGGGEVKYSTPRLPFQPVNDSYLKETLNNRKLSFKAISSRHKHCLKGGDLRHQSLTYDNGAARTTFNLVLHAFYHYDITGCSFYSFIVVVRFDIYNLRVLGEF